ncbi:MAG: bifunctional phosphoribosyl-AMP cyclohydrolase/phosphoribosyl-ATP diphosphatase HisIE, partial [Firmicutes bacterium]|nr:bifunctional phosphoribosyl-AMP cyclohydrolase/phosphoribosyl-ATP diphosphatase HisIE [Bacillota bacterium]
MTDIGEIRFDANGLVPAVVTDAASGKVLMLAYMNEESLKKTIQTGLATFWSRSRQELWTKGETSGNYMHVVSITADCDRDSLVIKARPDGPACHLGTESCFEYPLFEGEAPDEDFSLESLYKLLQGRKAELPEGSYTTYLFQKGTDKILKKVG